MAPERDAGADPRRQAEGRRRLTILFVENEVLIRFATADLLRGESHEVLEAATGEEALSLLEAGVEFDLLLSDLHMPGSISGLHLVRHMASRRPGVAALITSSHLPEEGVDNTRFLAKPYTNAALLKAVQDAVDPTGRK